MPSVWIAEFSALAEDNKGSSVYLGQHPLRASQRINLSGSSIQSVPFNDGTKFIELHSDAAFHYVVSATPLASLLDTRIEADGHSGPIGVYPRLKVAVIIGIQALTGGEGAVGALHAIYEQNERIIMLLEGIAE